jgi:hypothetical protein
MRLAGRHAEDVPEVSAIESVAQVQLADLSIHGVHPREGRAHLGAAFHLLSANGEGTRIVHRVGRLIQPR